MYILWNDHCINLVNIYHHIALHISFLWWESLRSILLVLSNIWHSTVNHSHCAIHYIPRTYFMTWSLYFWQPSPIVHTGTPLCFSSLRQPPICSLYLWVWLIFYISHTSEIIQYLSFCVWLISLSIMASSFTHIFAKDRISFLRPNNTII